MNNIQSRDLVQGVLLSASLWIMLGVIIFRDTNSLNPFLQVFAITAFDLGFLILLFWSIFFSKSTQSVKQVQAVIFITFKLVCLGILAITLKRLRNASPEGIALGVGYMMMGPLLSGAWVKLKVKRQQG